jgi:hypothetical protein
MMTLLMELHLHLLTDLLVTMWLNLRLRVVVAVCNPDRLYRRRCSDSC